MFRIKLNINFFLILMIFPMVVTATGKLPQGQNKPLLFDTAANVEQIQKVHCRYPVLNDDLKIEDYFSAKERQSEKASFQYKNFYFPSEYPFYFALFKRFVDVDKKAGPDLESQKQRALKILARNCATVACVLKGLFGEKQMLKAMYLLDKYEFNVSSFRHRDTVRFSDEDLKIILDTLSLTPPHLLPLKSNQQLTFGRLTQESAQEKVFANSDIYFFKSWGNVTREEKIYFFFHEMAHNWALNTYEELDESDEWLKISGWIKVPSMFAMGWSHPAQWSFDPNQWISNYAQANSWEDFAESISAYRFNPRNLLHMSPKRYEFIRNKIFGGVEFINEEKCQLKKVDTAPLEKKAEQLLERKISVYSPEIGQIIQIPLRQDIENKCLGFLAQTVNENLAGAQAFRACFRQILFKQMPEAYVWALLDREVETSTLTLGLAQKNFISRFLFETFINSSTESIVWWPSQDVDCSAFGRNFRGRFILTTPINRSEKNDAAKAMAASVGESICEAAKLNPGKVAAVQKSAFNVLLKRIYQVLDIQ